MESLEGVHSVQLSSSPPFGPSSSSRGYELIRAGRSGIAVYSNNATFFTRTPEERCIVGSRGYELIRAGRSGIAVYSNNATFFTRTPEERCIVGRLVDLEAQPDMEEREGPGRADAQSQAEEHRDDHLGNVSRLRSSSLEIRERGSEILRQQLDTAQKELQMKGEECARLSQVREQLETELEELTASLFEEAHKMVREANVKQAAAEKQLKEAQGKIDVLQAEVVALKTLVLTSTPSSPNRQLHPQLQSPGGGSRGPHRHGGGGAHVRNKSASGALLPGGSGSTYLDPSSVSAQTRPTEDRESVSTLMSLFQCVFPAHPVRTTMVGTSRKGAGPLPLITQMDSVLYAEFLSWRERPVLEPPSAFLGRVYREDIRPCLSFTRSELSQLVQSAVENNSLTIEPVGVASVGVVKASAECGGPKKCALSGLSRLCRHRIKLGDNGNYYYICPSSRARITSVCNFFTYIRYIQQGLVRHDAEQMFWEVMRLRREMTVTKLGFYTTDHS